MFKYIIFIFLVGCSVVTDNDNDSYKVLAKVDDKVLLVDDIIYQKSMGDSSVIITNQINNWLKKQLLLKSAYQTEELKSIIDKTAGFSGAEIKATCVEAGMIAIRQGRGYITQDDFLESVKRINVKKINGGLKDSPDSIYN